MPPSRARRNQRALIPRRVLHEILDDVCLEITRFPMRLSRQAREMLQAEGERYLYRLFRRIALLMQLGDHRTAMYRHLEFVMLLDVMDQGYDGPLEDE